LRGAYLFLYPAALGEIGCTDCFLNHSEQCRVRHLKCDRKKPNCSRCLKDDVECVSRTELPEPPKKKAR
ncbi:hypothetical protein KCU59_g63, partial [Aureobasidium melanogenum]